MAHTLPNPSVTVKVQVEVRWIVSALLVRDGAVLLVKRSPAKRAYPNTWSFPGGHVEPGEALDAALVREVGEEVGLVPTCFRQIGTIEKLDPEASGAVTCHYLYAVTAWDGGEPVLVGNEHTELRWCALEHAASIEGLAMADYGGFFERIRQGKQESPALRQPGAKFRIS
jgi:8-oxo-dGTP diphosphatase